MKANHSPRAPPDSTDRSAQPIRNFPCTEVIGGRRFHLFQHVLLNADGPSPKSRVVVSLEDGITLADLNFNWTSSYSEADIATESIQPQTADSGIPVFAY